MLETPQEILEQIASRDAAFSFIQWRKIKKSPLTARAAGMVMRTLLAIKAQGGDPDEALDVAQERGWLTIKSEWYWRDKQQNQPQLKSINGGGHVPHNIGRSDPALEQIARIAGIGKASGDDRP